jgi:hypothetical protein
MTEVPCPECGAAVEIFWDEDTGRCRRCGHRFPNPNKGFDCAQWCAMADACLDLVSQRPPESVGDAAAGKDSVPGPQRFAMPGRQDNLQRAEALAFDALSRQSAEQMLWLGARGAAPHWQLPVLENSLEIDLAARRITTSAGQAVRPAWRILLLHYLAITGRPEDLVPEVTFADLPSARTYAGVYKGRVISRLCATAGRDAPKLCAAAAALGGRAVAGGDAAFDFTVFPRLVVRLVWHAPDNEFPPSATLLLPRNAEAYLCTEDLVVLSERLVARLGDRAF